MPPKIFLEHIHKADLTQIDNYMRFGGYESVPKALKTMSPDGVMDEVKKSGLRGRGGAGFPTGLKWSFLDRRSNYPRYLVCNADESEPGTFKDRYLMEYNPHILIEGLIVSSYALGANTTYIYIRGEYWYLIDILERAIAQAIIKGLRLATD